MRVALIGSNILSDNPSVPDRIGRWLAVGMAERHQVEAHYMSFAPHLERDRVTRLPQMTVHEIACPSWPRFSVRQYFGPGRIMARALARLAPDIAHSQYLDWGPFAQESGMPTVVTVHGMYHREVAVRRPRRRLAAGFHLHFFWKSLRQVRHIIGISPYVEKELGPHTDATFWYVPNPIRPEFFDLAQDRAEPGRILFAGRLIPRKCGLELIRAFSLVHRACPEARLRLVGTPDREDYVRQIRRLVAREQLERSVDFVGQLGPDDGLFDEFERAAILVLMARQETAPLVVSEAMAAGKAVVASRVCGIPYMVDDGVTGLLADRDDVEGFARCMERLLENPDQCREMGRRGREKAIRQFHPDRVVDETVRVYHRVIESW